MEELEKIVMSKYPKNKEELACRPLRERMNALRNLYRERLKKELEQKNTNNDQG